MTQIVDSLMVNEGPSNFYTSAYRVAVEDFIPTLLASPATVPTAVDPATTNRFRGDFFGLLYFLRIPPQHHYPIMRLNGLVDSSDYVETMTEILMPNLSELTRIAQTEASSNTNNS